MKDPVFHICLLSFFLPHPSIQRKTDESPSCRTRKTCSQTMPKKYGSPVVFSILIIYENLVKYSNNISCYSDLYFTLLSDFSYSIIPACKAMPPQLFLLHPCDKSSGFFLLPLLHPPDHPYFLRECKPS